MTETTKNAAVFADHRSLLFTVAYELLGSVADAEDVVQESYLRWDARPDGEVEHPRAYLVRITTRLALNRLRAVARRREEYVGPWLPEPVLTTPDVLDDVVLAESVSLAMLVVLESLNPAERAVFVLREVFGYDYDEIAAALDKTSASVRQIAHRAKEHVHARRPRFEPDRRAVDAVQAAFVKALFDGNVQALMDLMAPDVVLLSDSNGKRAAARRPVNGSDNVARFMVGIMRKGAADAEFAHIRVNGMPAVASMVDGVPDQVAQLVVAEGKVAQVLIWVDAEKLQALRAPREVTLDG